MYIKNENNNSLKIEWPKELLEQYARSILPHIIDFYQSEDGRKEYEKWKEKQNSCYQDDNE